MSTFTKTDLAIQGVMTFLCRKATLSRVIVLPPCQLCWKTDFCGLPEKIFTPNTFNQIAITDANPLMVVTLLLNLKFCCSLFGKKYYWIYLTVISIILMCVRVMYLVKNLKIWDYTVCLFHFLRDYGCFPLTTCTEKVWS